MRISLAAFVVMVAAVLLNIPKAASVQANGDASSPLSLDCSAKAALLPHGVSRIFISLRNGVDGKGTSPQDARDGSTAAKFDQILRCFSEGCADPTDPERQVRRTENLIVCLGPGTFETKGQYDFLINVPHARPEGFTLGKGWKLHGAGKDKTTVQLSAYLPVLAADDPRHVPAGSGLGVVFSTNSDDALGIEISDLTVDANYPSLKKLAGQQGIKALNLEAIHLRSNKGGDWIHDIRVINAAGEITESFPVWIASVQQGVPPTENNGNVIERVNMSKFGAGECTAIAVANAAAQVRNNAVDGYPIAYGGWQMGPVWFHDNFAINTEYGFNIDSLKNEGVRIERNLIVHPRRYGIVIGGDGAYAGFKISGNIIEINNPGSIGLVFRGNVTESAVSRNTIVAPPGIKATAIRNYAADWRAKPNVGNIFQSNRLAGNLRVVFSGFSWKSRSCIAANKDENGRPSKTLSDNHSGECTISRNNRAP